MTGGYLWPRCLDREFAEIHESWRWLREAVARDWDRALGTGPTPIAFRLAEKVAERMTGPTVAERAAALVPLIRAAAADVPIGELDGHVRDLAAGRVGWVPDSWTVVQPQSPADPNFDLYGAAREMHQAMAAAPPFVPWGPA